MNPLRALHQFLYPRASCGAARARLGVLPLESRINHVANVVTSFSAGTLTLIGVNSSVAADNNQGLGVTDVGGGAVQVGGSIGTLIDGQASVTFSGVKSLVIKMGLGTDFVGLGGLSLSGPVTIN